MEGRASLWTCVRSRNIRSLVELTLPFLLTSGTERCKRNRATRKPWRAERLKSNCTAKEDRYSQATMQRKIIAEPWQPANFWRVGRYVILLDNVHLFCAPNTIPVHPLKKWIEYWRNHAARHWP